MRVNNVTSIAISGVIVISNDKTIEALELDGRAIIEFDPIAPGESITYSEQVSGIRELFPNPIQVRTIALDVIDTKGVQIIDDLFMARWPDLKSQEDLDFAARTFCKNATPSE